MAKNIEFNARVKSHDSLRDKAQALGARQAGILHQHDTYFRVKKGRKKIRSIAGSHSELIRYFRSDEKKARESRYFVKKLLFPAITMLFLNIQHGILVEVVKKRELWLWKSVRIHLDDVVGLGLFMELEAVVADAGSMKEAESQCQYIMDKLNITNSDIIGPSYSDMLIYH